MKEASDVLVTRAEQHSMGRHPPRSSNLHQHLPSRSRNPPRAEETTRIFPLFAHAIWAEPQKALEKWLDEKDDVSELPSGDVTVVLLLDLATMTVPIASALAPTITLMALCDSPGSRLLCARAVGTARSNARMSIPAVRITTSRRATAHATLTPAFSVSSGSDPAIMAPP